MNPWTDPALACELTLRERQALMTEADWEPLVDKVLSQPIEPRATAQEDGDG